MGRVVTIVDNHLVDPCEIVWDSPEDSNRAIGQYRGIFVMLDRTNEGPDTWQLGTVARPGIENDTLTFYAKTVQTTLTVTKDD